MDAITPRDLARELGHVEQRRGAKIRKYLRAKYPDHVKNQLWELTPEQADDVRRHFRRS
ncbi:hypothetical protein [Microbacterium sp. JZ31]|uniref:hypothetical protein n=1 Tax=Microbacterium sp. JZ31 TaxID=1906274 RepID=UPI0019338651|nr:hypothetical protein [Microbacterium sp. JZ31]